MTGKKLGKIQNVYMGIGGYNDAQFGINFTLGGKGWGVQDFWGFWEMEPIEYAKWNKQEQREQLGDVCLRIIKLLKEANVYKVQDLNNLPIEVEFDGNLLKSWRILTEVI